VFYAARRTPIHYMLCTLSWGIHPRNRLATVRSNHGDF